MSRSWLAAWLNDTKNVFWRAEASDTPDTAALTFPTKCLSASGDGGCVSGLELPKPGEDLGCTGNSRCVSALHRGLLQTWNLILNRVFGKHRNAGITNLNGALAWWVIGWNWTHCLFFFFHTLLWPVLRIRLDNPLESCSYLPTFRFLRTQLPLFHISAWRILISHAFQSQSSIKRLLWEISCHSRSLLIRFQTESAGNKQ